MIHASLNYFDAEKFNRLNGNSTPMRGELIVSEFTVPIRDYRSFASTTTANSFFNENGFVVLKHQTKVPVFEDPMQVRKVYRKEVRALARSLYPKAKEIFVMEPLLRSEENKNTPVHHATSERGHRIVHNDYSNEYAAFLRKLNDEMAGFFTSEKEGKASREALKKSKRIIVLNMWRQTLNVELNDTPLALCSKKSIDMDDLVARPLPDYNSYVLPDGYNVYLSKYNRNHEWFYVPRLMPDELIVFKTFDEGENPFRPVLHSAFDLKDGFGPKRKSCEIRVILTFDQVEDGVVGLGLASHI